MKRIAVLALLFISTVAHAGDLPELRIDANWSNRAGPSAAIEAAEQTTRFQWLYLYVSAGILLPRIGGGNSAWTVPEGVSPSRLGAGVAFAYDWSRPHFTGYLLGAIDLGTADVIWGAYGGAHGRLDLDYAILYGDLRGFAAPGLPTTYDFGLRIHPYVKFIDVFLDCDSSDGAAEEHFKPCGVGARLSFRLPGTPISLAIAGKAAFFDLRGRIGDPSAHLGLTVYVSR